MQQFSEQGAAHLMGAAHLASNEGVLGQPTTALAAPPAADMQSTGGSMLALLESLSPSAESSGGAAHGSTMLPTPVCVGVSMPAEAAANTWSMSNSLQALLASPTPSNAARGAAAQQSAIPHASAQLEDHMPASPAASGWSMSSSLQALLASPTPSDAAGGAIAAVFEGEPQPVAA